MRSPFIDLCTRMKEASERGQFISIAKQLGWHGITSPMRFEQTQNVSKKSEIKLYSRTDLNAGNTEELKRQVTQVRRQTHIVSVKCKTAIITKWAALDNRIDVLRFDSRDIRKLFDKSTAKMINENGKALEIQARQIIFAHNLIPIIRHLSKAVAIAQRKNCPIVVSSGARDPWELRAPRDLAGLMDLINLPFQEALKCVSDTPWGIITQNERKLKSQVAPGIFKYNEEEEF